MWVDNWFEQGPSYENLVSLLREADQIVSEEVDLLLSDLEF